MSDELRKINESFQEFLKIGLNEERYDIEQIKLTEDSFKEFIRFLVPFGFIEYFLARENGKPMVCFHLATRMDTDTICFVYEDFHECHDVFMSDPSGARKKFGDYRKQERRKGREIKIFKNNPADMK